MLQPRIQIFKDCIQKKVLLLEDLLVLRNLFHGETDLITPGHCLRKVSHRAFSNQCIQLQDVGCTCNAV